ncbi:hypothetical protein [Sphingobacterium kitahiroshimense]|uniref:Uncharacterized protein n=1 Tax=Sphingobacterium kitahiroshimense TaxID=470446 RepID=A0ABV0BTG1_9SPHI
MSCSNDSSFIFTSSNGAECFTIKTKGNIRVIASEDAKTNSNGYIKLDLSNVDRTAGDQVIGCWNKNMKRWEIRMDHVIILENKLDTTQYTFIDHFPYDESTFVKIPNTKGFNDSNCFSISFEYNEIVRVRGDVRLLR